jgi:uncharacterized protein YndB with AHSA1/START domain
MSEAANEVSHEVLLAASADRVWRAWAEPRYLSQWISGHAQVDADVRVGGEFRLVLPGDRAPMVVTGVYLEVEQYAHLSMTWREDGGEESQLEIRLSDAGDPTRTRLTLAHRGLSKEAAEDHRSGWQEMLAVLAEYLAL